MKTISKINKIKNIKDNIDACDYANSSISKVNTRLQEQIKILQEEILVNNKTMDDNTFESISFQLQLRELEI